MQALERKPPHPIPPVHAQPEYLVSGQRARWYADMKNVFQVPWMGVVTMAFSHYPRFFEVLWDGLKPIAQSRPFVDACTELRSYVSASYCRARPSQTVIIACALGM